MSKRFESVVYILFRSATRVEKDQTGFDLIRLGSYESPEEAQAVGDDLERIMNIGATVPHTFHIFEYVINDDPQNPEDWFN